jgi:energy-converting hydrogenase Eha subunit E
VTRLVAGIQGAYYVVTGIWPLVSLGTFERVTGPKVDDWLVRTVGLLAATIGSVLGLRAMSERSEPDALLGTGAALAFAAVDTTYAATGRISKIYLADAAVELLIAAAWLIGLRSRSSRRFRRGAN